MVPYCRSGSEPKSGAAYGFEMRRAGLAKRAGRGLSTITTNKTRHLSQPPIQQTRQPSMRSPSATGLKSRRNLVSTYLFTSLRSL